MIHRCSKQPCPSHDPQSLNTPLPGSEINESSHSCSPNGDEYWSGTPARCGISSSPRLAGGGRGPAKFPVEHRSYCASQIPPRTSESLKIVPLHPTMVDAASKRL